MTTATDPGVFFRRAFRDLPVMVILRGVGPDTAVSTARAAWDRGLRLVEVTVERPEGLDALAAVAAAAPDGAVVGAGTVTTPELLRAAAHAGARFGVAPSLDPDTVAAAHDAGVPFLPGVATPTEVGQAVRLGLTVVKAFPAGVLTPAWVRALAGPFPNVSVVATGGIDATNGPAFLAAGAIGLGVGQSVTRGNALNELLDAVREGSERDATRSEAPIGRRQPGSSSPATGQLVGDDAAS